MTATQDEAGRVETVRRFDFVTLEWRETTVAVPAEPVRRAARRRRRPGRTVSYAGLLAGSPVPDMQDTAYAEAKGYTGFADMRTFVPEPVMKTHRAPTVMPAGNAADNGNGARWHNL